MYSVIQIFETGCSTEKESIIKIKPASQIYAAITSLMAQENSISNRYFHCAFFA
jgi:hypothetical protein